MEASGQDVPILPGISEHKSGFRVVAELTWQNWVPDISGAARVHSLGFDLRVHVARPRSG